MYLAVRASRERVVELLRAHDVDGYVLRPTATGWAGILVEGVVPEGILAPLLVQELGDVITVHSFASVTEVVVRGELGTERLRLALDASDPAPNPAAVASRLQALSGRPVARDQLERTLLGEETVVALIRSLAAQLDLPDLVPLPDRQVVVYAGTSSVVRAWAMSTVPVLLAPSVDGWQLAVPHPHEFGAGELLAGCLVHGPFTGEGERALVLGRSGEERSVALGGDPAAGELVSVSWEWNPYARQLPPPVPRTVAAKLAQAFPGSDVERVERALATTDADRGLADVLAALGVPGAAADVLEQPLEELVQSSEGVGRGSRRDVVRELAAPGVLPRRPRGPVLRWTDRALGLTSSVLGVLMILVAVALFVLGVTLEDEGLLPRNPWGLLVLGVALTYLGRRQHMRGTA